MQYSVASSEYNVFYGDDNYIYLNQLMNKSYFRPKIMSSLKNLVWSCVPRQKYISEMLLQLEIFEIDGE